MSEALTGPWSRVRRLARLARQSPYGVAAPLVPRGPSSSCPLVLIGSDCGMCLTGGVRREHSAARHVSNQLDAYTDSSYMKRKTSPKDARCPHCGGWYTQRGVKEHLRHHCRPCPTSRKRVFNNATCKHCGLTYHSGNSLRVHVATQHKHEYARSPNSVRHHRAPHSKKKRNHQTSGARVHGTVASPPP